MHAECSTAGEMSRREEEEDEDDEEEDEGVGAPAVSEENNTPEAPEAPEGGTVAALELLMEVATRSPAKRPSSDTVSVVNESNNNDSEESAAPSPSRSAQIA